LQVLKHEQMNQVIVQFGGQTAINVVQQLEKDGVTLLGSSMDTIDMLEDRDRFYSYAKKVDVAHIPGLTAVSEKDLFDKAKQIGYPVLIRPSYVIGGKGMAIIEQEAALSEYIEQHLTTSSYPILLDAY